MCNKDSSSQCWFSFLSKSSSSPCTSKQVTKNEFRHIHIVLLVHDDRYSVSIVPHRDLVCISADFNLEATMTRIDTTVKTRRARSVHFYAYVSTLIVSIEESLCLLSAALTMISSKILYRPGTNVIGLIVFEDGCQSEYNTHSRTRSFWQQQKMTR
jgi:hypothetical protein